MAPNPPHPSVAALDALVGEWASESDTPGQPAATTRSTTIFEWMDGGRFLIQRSPGKPPFPSSLALIGRQDPDDPSSPLVMHYFDSRGVNRLYAVTFENNVLTLARDDEDFSQRFRGILSNDGSTLAGAWEVSDGPGQPLHHDFDVSHRRVK